MYTYINEIMGGRLRLIFSGIAYGVIGLSGIMVNVLSIKFNHYRFYVYFSTIGIVLTSLLYYYFLESPFYLYKQKKFDELYKCLLKMCERNYSKAEFNIVKLKLENQLGPDNSEDKNDEFINNQNKQKTVKIPLLNNQNDTVKIHPKIKNTAQIFKHQNKFQFIVFFTKKNLLIFIKLIFIFFQIELTFGLSMIINKDLGISNVYLSGSLICLFQTIGYFTSSLITLKFKRRTINISSSVSICILSLMLLMVDLISNIFHTYSLRSISVRVLETGNCD